MQILTDSCKFYPKAKRIEWNLAESIVFFHNTTDCGGYATKSGEKRPVGKKFLKTLDKRCFFDRNKIYISMKDSREKNLLTISHYELTKSFRVFSFLKYFFL